MSRMMNALVLPAAAAAAGAFGGSAIEASAASAAQNPFGAQEATTGLLNDFGPAYSTNLATANQELDERLSEEGPNGCTAEAIAEVAGITTAAGRAKYITPGNVSFKDLRNVTNQQYPNNAGATNSCTPVEIPNQHSSSLAFDVEFNSLPKSSQNRAKRLSNGALELVDGVIRQACGGNPLTNGHRVKQQHKQVTPNTNLNVSVGVIQAAVQFAPSVATSESSSSSTITCPDGTTVSVVDSANAQAQASAEASAIASTLGNIEGETFEISGENMTFTQFQQEFTQDVATAEGELTAAAAQAATNVSTTANSSSNLSAECGSTPTPPITPTPPQTPTESVTETELTTSEPVFPDSPEQLCVDAEQVNTDSSGHKSTSVPVVTFKVVSGEGTDSGIYGDQDGDPNHLCVTFTSGPDYGQQSEIDATASSNDGGIEPPVVQKFTIATQQDGF
jgi:hypothetical protein